MAETEIVAAIRAFTDHVRVPTNVPALDISAPGLTAEELAAWRSDVESVCAQMDALANNPNSRFSEFEKLRHKMGPALFPPVPDGFIQRIADAFRAAGRA